MAATQVLAMKGHFEVIPTDIHISFLPIAHVFERFVMWCVIQAGANACYAKFPTPEIMKDLAAIKPTFMPIVPRLLNKFYPAMKAIYEKEGSYQKVKAIFGGRMRLMVTGSAPVSP